MHLRKQSNEIDARGAASGQSSWSEDPGCCEYPFVAVFVYPGYNEARNYQSKGREARMESGGLVEEG